MYSVVCMTIVARSCLQKDPVPASKKEKEGCDEEARYLEWTWAMQQTNYDNDEAEESMRMVNDFNVRHQTCQHCMK